jgi:hypothetical protein
MKYFPERYTQGHGRTLHEARCNVRVSFGAKNSSSDLPED